MSRRKKDQGLDFLVSILKTIAKNREGYSAPQLQVMLLAADRLAFIESTTKAYVTNLDQPKVIVPNPEGFSGNKPSPVAEMLKQLKLEEKNAATTDPSEPASDGKAIRTEVDVQGNSDLHG